MAFSLRNVIDPQGAVIIIGNGSQPLSIYQSCPGGSGQIDVERFIGLHGGIPNDLDGYRLAHLARRDGQGTTGHGVVAVRCGGAVDGSILHGYWR